MKKLLKHVARRFEGPPPTLSGACASPAGVLRPLAPDQLVLSCQLLMSLGSYTPALRFSGLGFNQVSHLSDWRDSDMSGI